MKSVNERFWSKCLAIKNGCWEWQGWCYSNGYGRFSHSSIKHELAHRLAYKLFHRVASLNKFVLHSCDNKKCVNPKHLWLGTQFDNMQDASKKGRCSKNEWRKTRAPFRTHFKLTIEQVREIRKLYALGGISQNRLGIKFNISQMQISHIIRRIHWK